MPTLKPDHEVALRCLYWLPADVRPTAELLAELMYVSDAEATQMLSELRSARLLANARARGIPCAALERRAPHRAPAGIGRPQARDARDPRSVPRRRDRRPEPTARCLGRSAARRGSRGPCTAWRALRASPRGARRRRDARAGVDDRADQGSGGSRA